MIVQVVVYCVSLHPSEVLRVSLGEYLPPRALVIHRVLQAVPVFVIGGVIARVSVPRAPVLVQVLESGQVPITGCASARARTPIKVVLSRPLQQSYTPTASTVVTYEPRSFIKKSDDSLVGQRQSFVVVQQVYFERTLRPRMQENLPVRLGVELEPERVRGGRLGGVPPQLAHPSGAVAGPDALHVGEHQGRDIQAGIEGWSIRIELAFAVPELHGDGAGRRVRRRGYSWSWLLLSREKMEIGVF